MLESRLELVFVCLSSIELVLVKVKQNINQFDKRNYFRFGYYSCNN